VTPRAALLVALGAALAEVLARHALDRLGLIEGLLSPSGASPLLLVPLALCFFAARLFVWFVAPGLLLGAVIVSFRPRPSERN
jgi:hypothetical protein